MKVGLADAYGCFLTVDILQLERITILIVITIDSFLMTQCCFSSLFGLKGKLSQCIFIGVEKTALKQCQFFLCRYSLEKGSVKKTKLVFKHKSYITFI